MESSGKKALKSGIWYTVCNFIIKGAGFLTTPIFTRLLSTNDIGEFSNLISWIGILAIVTTFELFSTIGVARFDFKDELDDYIASNLLMGSTITLGFYLVCLLFKNAMLSFFSFSELELHIAFLYLLSYPALAMYQGKKQINYQYKASVVLSLTSMLSAVFISLLAVVILDSQKLTGRILGYYGPMIFMNVGIYVFLLSKARHLRFQYCKYAIKFSAPLIIHLLAGNLLNSSDRVMIRNICGSTDAAMYTVSYSCAVIVQILWQSMNSAWSPWAYEMMSKENYVALRSASKPYLLFFGLISFGFLLIGPEMLWLMGGNEYISAQIIIPPVLVAYVFQFAYSLYVNVEFFYKKQQYIAIGTIIATIINIALNAIFIPLYGYIAAAYTTLVGYVILFLIHYAFTTAKLNKKHLFDSLFIFVFLFVFLCMTVFGLFLYEHTIIRHSILLCLIFSVLVALVIFRNELIYLLKHKSMTPLMNRLKKYHISF